MVINNEQDIISLIKQDDDMLAILYTVSTLQLPDWWVCAGVIRAKVWDTLHAFNKPTVLPDIDVIYYDPGNVNEHTEKQLEAKLYKLMPTIPWSVKNEARMHLVNNITPYKNSVDAMSKFPETATAIGVNLDALGEIKLAAPCGVDDLLSMHVKPTPFFLNTPHLMPIYQQRILQKQWQHIWPNIRLFNT